MHAAVLRQFSLSLRRRPGKSLFREPLWPSLPTESSLVPYIFSTHDIGRLLKLAGNLDRPPFRAALYLALRLLMYCTGLRFGEALRLRIRDVDTRQGTHFVETFRGRARWVPFDRSLPRELDKYLAVRGRFASAQSDERSFVGVHKTRLPVKTAGETLRGLFQSRMKEMGQDRPTSGAEVDATSRPLRTLHPSPKVVGATGSMLVGVCVLPTWRNQSRRHRSACLRQPRSERIRCPLLLSNPLHGGIRLIAQIRSTPGAESCPCPLRPFNPILNS
jgi:hypothetical protein